MEGKRRPPFEQELESKKARARLEQELDVILSGRQGREGSRADWQKCGSPTNKAVPILARLCGKGAKTKMPTPTNQIVIPNEVRNLPLPGATTMPGCPILPRFVRKGGKRECQRYEISDENSVPAAKHHPQPNCGPTRCSNNPRSPPRCCRSASGRLNGSCRCLPSGDRTNLCACALPQL